MLRLAVFCVVLATVLAENSTASTDCDCKHSDLYTKRVRECRKKYEKPNKVQKIQITKAVRAGVVNCTEEKAPEGMTPGQFAARLVDDKEFRKEVTDCYTQRSTEFMKEYGLGPEFSNRSFRKCMKDAEKLHLKNAIP